MTSCFHTTGPESSTTLFLKKFARLRYQSDVRQLVFGQVHQTVAAGSKFAMVTIDLFCVCRLPKRQRIAVRWSAPEVLLGWPQSPASNVWSYGVLAWEVMSLGQIPYNLWNDDQVAAAVTARAVLSRPSVCASCQLLFSSCT